ncbi:MAG: sugar transferase, partial [Thermodesulfobacteriota bacterium]|nr:sugar transferase [Thermodesulfobacteriota bacterium]
MYRDQAYILTNIIMVLDALVVILATYFSRWIYLNYFGGTWLMREHEFAGFIILTFFLNNTILAHFGFYSDRREHLFWPILVRLTKALVVLFVVISTGLFFFQGFGVSRQYLFVFAIVLLVFTIVDKGLMLGVVGMLADRGFHQRRILLVGNGVRSLSVVDALQKQQSWGHRIVGLLRDEDQTDPESQGSSSVPILGAIGELRDVILDKRVDDVIFAVPPNRPRSLQPYIEICERIGVSVRIVPAMFDPEGTSLRVEVLQGVPLLCRYSLKLDVSELFYKRFIDIFVGGLGTLFCFAVLYPLLGLAIKSNSPGPILFKQKRLGMHGRTFCLYKFRSMYVDAEVRKAELLENNEMQGPMFKMTDDPRVTKVGRFLRKTSLDEFPQFWNVFKGEMSLVGTRPPTPEEVTQYDDWHRRRISIKPGITGLWQISGRSRIDNFNEV